VRERVRPPSLQKGYVMLLNTRRRMLGLLAAAIGTSRFVRVVPRALAANPPECFQLQPFGDWKGVATNSQAGARIGQINFTDSDNCDLRGEIQVSETYDAKLVLFGDPEGTPLPKDFLVKPDNRIIAKNEDGSTAVDEPLCGVCTDIRDDKVSIVLPLLTGALFRSAKSVEMAVKLGDAKQCSFTLNCEDLRKALDWAVDRKSSLARDLDDKKCTAPNQACFITTACCEILGLDDDCFELRTLRCYRDRVLPTLAGGEEAVSAYYRLAPAILEQLPSGQRDARLTSIYARFILPSAVAAWLGLNDLAYRIYAQMIGELVHGLMRDEAAR